MNTTSTESDPRHHTARIKQMLNNLLQHVRDDVTKVSEPKARALVETTAEVLRGLATAYEHYDAKAEPGWR